MSLISIIQKHKEIQKYLLQQKKGVHRMKNTNQMYLSAQEVANILGMSKSYAYTVIRKMNDECVRDIFITFNTKKIYYVLLKNKIQRQ